MSSEIHEEPNPILVTSSIEVTPFPGPSTLSVERTPRLLHGLAGALPSFSLLSTLSVGLPPVTVPNDPAGTSPAADHQANNKLSFEVTPLAVPSTLSVKLTPDRVVHHDQANTLPLHQEIRLSFGVTPFRIPIILSVRLTPVPVPHDQPSTSPPLQESARPRHEGIILLSVDPLPEGPIILSVRLTPLSTMEPKLYIAAKEGDVKFLESRLIRPQNNIPARATSLLPSFLTFDSNSLLHIAVCFQQRKFAKQVLNHAQLSLLVHPNSNGDTPLHIAARSGDLKMVELFIKQFKDNMASYVEAGVQDPLHAKNSCNNTALHEALICNRGEVALWLLQEDRGLANCVNNLGESPFYLSTQMGIVNVMKMMIHMRDADRSMSGPNQQTPLHAAAIFWRRPNFMKASIQKGYAKLLCSALEEDIRKRDQFGMTALHYAASNPSSDKLTLALLEIDRMVAYICDNDGLTPLITATTTKNWTVFDIILRFCPDCAEINCRDGQNVLHFAIKHNVNPAKILKHHKHVRELINKKDDNGDTPLHLAVKAQFTVGVTSLLQYKGIYLRARNGENHTALDLLETSWNSVLSKIRYREELLSQGSTRNAKGPSTELLIDYHKPSLDQLVQLAGTLLLVTTLIFNIAFSAAFTIPGGYSASSGLIVLGQKPAFKAFLISNALAVCSSLASGYFLVRGLIGYIFLRSAMGYAVLSLKIALLATMVAYSTRLYAVKEKTIDGLVIFNIVAVCGIPLCLKLVGHHILTRSPFEAKMIDKPEQKQQERHKILKE